MSSKQFAVLAVLMLVSQAMCIPPPPADECNPADDKTCLEGFVCVNVPACHPDPPRPDVCHPHNKCVPKQPLRR
ncbi:hypothetical protein Ddc_22180 [Ditylenchus destructor]|nr:hypothetical protein Ddc_22180 [Ditylenchus destructor]